MSFMNWFLEVKKWQTLVFSIKKIDLKEAAHQSLMAFSISLLTPNRIGEFGAKALFFEKKQYKKIMSLSVLGAFMQMLVSLVSGAAILVFGQDKFFPAFLSFDVSLNIKVIIILILMTVLMISIYFYYKQKIVFNPYLWKKTFVFSSLRYLVFSTQFVLLLHFFIPSVSYSVLYQGVFLTYFFATLIPMFSFLDWAVKSSIAIWVFALFNIHSAAIIKIVILMWGINFLIPFLMGWGLIIQRKTFFE